MFPLLFAAIAATHGFDTFSYDDGRPRRGCYEGEDDADKGGKGTSGDKTAIPYEEHKKVREQLASAKAALGVANAKIGEYEKQAPEIAKVAKERDDAIGRATNAEKDLQLRDLGVTDADDRAFIRERFNMTTKDQGDKAPEFATWLEAQREKRWFGAMVPDTVAKVGEQAGKGAADKAPASDYAANKGKPAAKVEGDGKGNQGAANGGAGANGERAKPAFNPNAGANGAGGNGGGAGGRPAFTRAEIAAMTPDEYRSNREAISTARRDGRIE